MPVRVCPPHDLLSPYLLLTPVVKYVYVHFWILVRELVMLISHRVMQLHQGDSLRRGGMFFMQIDVAIRTGLNLAVTHTVAVQVYSVAGMC